VYDGEGLAQEPERGRIQSLRVTLEKIIHPDQDLKQALIAKGVMEHNDDVFDENLTDKDKTTRLVELLARGDTGNYENILSAFDMAHQRHVGNFIIGNGGTCKKLFVDVGLSTVNSTLFNTFCFAYYNALYLCKNPFL
jgi:hypothetical protein